MHVRTHTQIFTYSTQKYTFFDISRQISFSSSSSSFSFTTSCSFSSFSSLGFSFIPFRVMSILSCLSSHHISSQTNVPLISHLTRFPRLPISIYLLYRSHSPFTLSPSSCTLYPSHCVQPFREPCFFDWFFRQARSHS